ncbi:MAG: hypothetical protein AAB776_01820 [Patescibacteria group bacterium]
MIVIWSEVGDYSVQIAKKGHVRPYPGQHSATIFRAETEPTAAAIHMVASTLLDGTDARAALSNLDQFIPSVMFLLDKSTLSLSRPVHHMSARDNDRVWARHTADITLADNRVYELTHYRPWNSSTGRA